MTSIVGLRGEQINDAGTNENVVELAREILAQVERGEIVGLAVVALRPNDEIGTLVAHRNKRHLLLAGMVYLQHDMSSE